MNIGFVGLGKMGLPLAVTMANNDCFDVLGFDIDGKKCSYDTNLFEAGLHGSSFKEHLENKHLKFADEIKQIVWHAEDGLIFIAVQTPHKERFDGTHKIPKDRADFNYLYLISAVDMITTAATDLHVAASIVVMSTCLPGTMKEYVEPRIADNTNVSLLYNPSFIAMGTTMEDFLFSELVLIGTRDHDSSATKKLRRFYDEMRGRSMIHPNVREMSFESAELAKVAYNTYISQKIVFANTLMEICDKIPEADVDDVTNALYCDTRRLMGPKYLRGGMGDGGACHPRDNIAMSFLAEELELSHNIFEDIMSARQDHAQMLADKLMYFCMARKLGACILGAAFKAESHMTDGSCALLVCEMLRDDGFDYILLDSNVSEKNEDVLNKLPHVYLIGCNHQRYGLYEFPRGSVVIDPWRMIPDQEGVEVLRVGEGEM